MVGLLAGGGRQRDKEGEGGPRRIQLGCGACSQMREEEAGGGTLRMCDRGMTILSAGD